MAMVKTTINTMASAKQPKGAKIVVEPKAVKK